MAKPNYEAIGAEVGRLVKEKQLAYGDSFGRSGAVLEQLYPNGITPDQYGDLLTIARILDKIFRIASDKDAFGENPYQDIVGYGLLGMGRHQKKEPI
jgi:hypothetical protein